MKFIFSLIKYIWRLCYRKMQPCGNRRQKKDIFIAVYLFVLGQKPGINHTDNLKFSYFSSSLFQVGLCFLNSYYFLLIVLAVLHIHSVVEECEIIELMQQIDPKTRKPMKKKVLFVKNGAAVICRIQVTNMICIEKFSEFQQLGRFTLRTEGQLLEVVLTKPQSDRKSDNSSPHYSGPHPNYIPQNVYGGFSSNPYGGSVGPRYGVTSSFQQPMIYGRGPVQGGMQRVSMVLPDGQIGQQPGAHVTPPDQGYWRKRPRVGVTSYKYHNTFTYSTTSIDIQNVK
ncbi:hypothetical protein LXL04_039661 [Taraxacum kok-saghyz]